MTARQELTLERVRFTLVGFMLGCAYYLGAEYLALHLAAISGLCLGVLGSSCWVVARGTADFARTEAESESNVTRLPARARRA